MKWKQIILLSLLGIVMALAVKFGITDTRIVMLFLWLIFPVVHAIALSRSTTHKLFLHGVISGTLQGVWMVALLKLAINFVIRSPSGDSSFVDSPAFFIIEILAATILLPGAITGGLALLAGKFITPQEKTIT
jgi:hypothetical protein